MQSQSGAAPHSSRSLVPLWSSPRDGAENKASAHNATRGLFLTLLAASLDVYSLGTANLGVQSAFALARHCRMKEKWDNSLIVNVKSSAMWDISFNLSCLLFSSWEKSASDSAQTSYFLERTIPASEVFLFCTHVFWHHYFPMMHCLQMALIVLGKKNNPKTKVKITGFLITSCLSLPGRSCRISLTAATGSRRAITWPSVTWSRWTELFTSRTSDCKWRPNSGEKSTTATGLRNR